MAKNSKSEIKKLIADLHDKNNPGQGSKPQHPGQSVNQKGSKGAKQSGTYRPKI